MKKITLLFLFTHIMYAADRTDKATSASWLAEEVAAINAAFDPIQMQYPTLPCASQSKAIKASGTVARIVMKARVHSKSKDSR